MTNTPMKVFGFTYQHLGKEFAFDVTAESESDAVKMVESMKSATLFGELKMSACVDAPNVQGKARE